MHFNLALPDFDGVSDDAALRQIKGYLTVLNEQLRYMMLNIDEDNFSGQLGDSLSDVSKTKETIEALEKSVNELDKKVTRLNSALGQKEKRLLLDAEGRLYFDTGFGDIPFSLGVTGYGSDCCLAVYNTDGNLIGSLELTV